MLRIQQELLYIYIPICTDVGILFGVGTGHLLSSISWRTDPNHLSTELDETELGLVDYRRPLNEVSGHSPLSPNFINEPLQDKLRPHGMVQAFLAPYY